MTFPLSATSCFKHTCPKSWLCRTPRKQIFSWCPVVSVHEGIKNPCIAFPHEPLCGYFWVGLGEYETSFRGNKKSTSAQIELSFRDLWRLSSNIMILEFQLPRVTNLPFVDQSYPSQAWEWIIASIYYTSLKLHHTVASVLIRVILFHSDVCQNCYRPLKMAQENFLFILTKFFSFQCLISTIDCQ